MKILFILPRMNNGGAERVVANLANELSKKYDVRIVTLVSKESFYELSEKIVLSSADIVLNRNGRFTRCVSMIKKLGTGYRFISKYIDEWKPDAVISFLFETDLLTFIASISRKFFWISSERNDPIKYNIIKRFLCKMIYSKTSFFVCQSSKVQEYYKHIKKTVVIPNPISNSAILDIEAENKTVVAVGRLTKQKNFRLLISAFSKIVDYIPKDINLKIYGEGPDREELQKMIDSENISDRVELVGAKKDIMNIIKKSMLFVSSSDYEGFPNAILEALAIGIPVIGTDVRTGTVLELVSDRYGIVVRCNDVEGLSAALLKMINENEYRLSIRGHYNSEIIEKYSITNIAGKWEKMLMGEISE